MSKVKKKLQVKKLQVIPVTGKQGFSWFEARKLARPFGGVARNCLIEEIFVRSPIIKEIRKLFPARDWRQPAPNSEVHVREILVALRSGQRYKKGEDIMDSGEYYDPPFVLPAKYVPKEVIGEKNAALIVDPGYEEENVEVNNSGTKRFIHPVKVQVLENYYGRGDIFPYGSSEGDFLLGMNMIDDATGFGVQVESEIIEKLQNSEVRWCGYFPMRTNVIPIRRFCNEPKDMTPDIETNLKNAILLDTETDTITILILEEILQAAGYEIEQKGRRIALPGFEPGLQDPKSRVIGR